MQRRHRLFYEIDALSLSGFRLWSHDRTALIPVWYGIERTRLVPPGLPPGATADSKRNEIWTSKPFSGTASSAAFNDTGNFRIVGSESSTLWDTFSNPTDTLLPTQTMGVYGELYSRRTETNFTRGRFQLRLRNDGNLVLNTRNILSDSPYDAYYESGTSDTNPNNQGYQVKFNESGYMYILRRNGDIVELTTNKAIPSTGYYHRATLTYDGILVQYYHPKVFTGTTGWTRTWQEPVNICTAIREYYGGGACGFNSICTSDGSRKDCECRETYSLLDPNDKHGGCKPNFTQNCDRNDSIEDLHDFVERPGTDWPLSGYERMNPISEPECKRLCLIDCFCVAAYYNGNSCWKMNLPLRNGRKDKSVVGKTYLKISKGDLPRESHPGDPVYFKTKKIGSLVLVGSVLLGSSVLVNIILIIVACFGSFDIYHKKTIKLKPANNIVETNVCRFTNNELVEATNGFEEELGRGSFGIVYKGLIHMSSTVIVAVKKIDRLVQDGAREFKTEVNVIAQTHHKNLVRLIGFCEEEEHRLLVYEYMVNGTLATLIFGSAKPSWAQRNHIALGIARDHLLPEKRGGYIESGDKAILTDWVWDCFQDGRIFDLVDKDNEDILSDWEKVEIFVMVGIWCIQEDPSLRPTMRKAIQMLEGVADIPYPPCPSPFL
ncbi:Receptor-like serine/threonine-protein kinase [Heracleum sosnowskyi]|uniref:non-specific serine/threonine protein kinase n=1 Tax=Heracleum sosnowskyi TaxID=360622 RepID=A0AAD8MF46_9APIA|nr:Receptor-like serine/threonine-protein kinase [Heracleum sosnowskyi]